MKFKKTNCIALCGAISKVWLVGSWSQAANIDSHFVAMTVACAGYRAQVQRLYHIMLCGLPSLLAVLYRNEDLAYFFILRLFAFGRLSLNQTVLPSGLLDTIL